MRLLIALAHIVGVASHFQGVLFNVLQSYFSGIVMPFSFYFLLCADEQWLPTLRRWEVKWAAMILLPSIAETGQYFGIPDRSISRMSLKNSKCRVNVVFTTWSYEAKLPIL